MKLCLRCLSITHITEPEDQFFGSTTVRIETRFSIQSDYVKREYIGDTYGPNKHYIYYADCSKFDLVLKPHK